MGLRERYVNPDGSFKFPEPPRYDHHWIRRLTRSLRKFPLVPEDAIEQWGARASSYDRPLTKREKEVLECMSRGMERKGTADLLGISQNTVQIHLKTARMKLGAKNALHACCEAIRSGQISQVPSGRK